MLKENYIGILRANNIKNFVLKPDYQSMNYTDYIMPNDIVIYESKTNRNKIYVHTGLVYSVTETRIQTIEGNLGGRVSKRNITEQQDGIVTKEIIQKYENLHFFRYHPWNTTSSQ